MEQLSDIKAKSIVEWIAHDRVRRSIVRHFRHFLMTYVDDHGASVYGQRIRHLGESVYIKFHGCHFMKLSFSVSQLGIFGSFISTPGNVQAHLGLLSHQLTHSNT